MLSLPCQMRQPATAAQQSHSSGCRNSLQRLAGYEDLSLSTIPIV